MMAQIPDMFIKVEMTDDLKERLDRVDKNIAEINIKVDLIIANLQHDMAEEMKALINQRDIKVINEELGRKFIEEDIKYWKEHPGARGTTHWVRDEDGDGYEVIDED